MTNNEETPVIKGNIVLGIDLGTTYSAMAWINQHGKPEIIHNREGGNITPSVVVFADDTTIVGQNAKNSALNFPQDTCALVKRQMGSRDWDFLNSQDESFTAEEISALILKKLKEDAELPLDQEVLDAVITVPAYFGDPERTATRQAGEIAGLNVVSIINEPTAAALAYGLTGDHAQSGDQTVMVYDLGGGTFDITIIRISNGSPSVLVTGGDKNLGGFDWDNEIIKFFEDRIQEETGKPVSIEDIKLQHELREKAETIKKTLSNVEKSKAFLFANQKNVQIELTRSRFEELSRPLLDRTWDMMEQTMEDAKLEWNKIDKILLVGGSTRMPAVAAMIENKTGIKPSREQHPDEVVAIGAALQGGILLKKDKTKKEIEKKNVRGLPSVTITDVNPHSMGVVTVDVNDQSKKLNSVIIPHNTPIPTKMSDIFQTVEDNQRSLHVQITEGEGKLADLVEIIGEGEIAIPPYPAGAPVEIFFEYNRDGQVTATVIDKTSGQKLGDLKIDRTRRNRSEDEVTAMARKISDIKPE